METPLSIDVLFWHDHQQETVNYFTDGSWTAETEALLMQNLHSLINSIKPVVKSLKINFNIEVDDSGTADIIINKARQKTSVKQQKKLSEREEQVLFLIIQGLTNSKIAEKLFISFETVRSHRKNILIKSKVKNTAALINHYYRSIHATIMFFIYFYSEILENIFSFQNPLLGGC